MAEADVQKTWKYAEVYVPPEPRETPREAVLSEAARLITGERNKSYGSPTQNFTNTAKIWNAQLGHKLKDGESIQPEDVALLMIGLKLARMVANPKRDNLTDIAGYAACGWEVIENKTREE